MRSNPNAPATPHQRGILLRIAKRIEASGRPATSEAVGSRGACIHLRAKGLVVEVVDYGPRGGEHYLYRLTDAGAALVDRIRERSLKVGGR